MSESHNEFNSTLIQAFLDHDCNPEMLDCKVINDRILTEFFLDMYGIDIGSHWNIKLNGCIRVDTQKGFH